MLLVSMSLEQSNSLFQVLPLEITNKIVVLATIKPVIIIQSHWRRIFAYFKVDEMIDEITSRSKRRSVRRGGYRHIGPVRFAHDNCVWP